MTARIPRRERALWARAVSLADLGGLTARWLEGSLTAQPPLDTAPYRPDEETHDLVPALAAACRAGYVTCTSQPGHGPETGWDGALYRQRAAVSGLVDDPVLLRELRLAATRAGLLALVRRADGPGARIPVTVRDAAPVTWAGEAEPAAYLSVLWHGCSPAALAAVTAATHLTLIDPDYAPRQRLWNVLAGVAHEHTEAA